MLGALRRKFVAIIMCLVGAVMVATLGSFLWSSHSSLEGQVQESLSRALDNSGNTRPIIGGNPYGLGQGHTPSLLAVTITVDTNGLLLSTENSPAIINNQTLYDVVETVMATDETEGRITSKHVAWRSEKLDSGAVRIAVVDTTLSDESFSTQLFNSTIGLVIGLAALFVIAWVISKWALAPVEQAWNQQKRFVSDASHELKTPLAVIVANMGILDKDENLLPESRRWVQSSNDAARQMQGLVGDLLELARTDETTAGGSRTLKKEDIDLSDMVESAALEFDAIAFEHGCLIDENIQPDIHIEGDRDWMSRLVKILIDNAVKYANDNTTINIDLKKAGNKVVFAVTDHGQVISPEDLPHLFDRFYRSDQARSRKTGGFGLGLAIAKGIAESHGGTITASSDEDKGTVFTVTL